MLLATPPAAATLALLAAIIVDVAVILAHELRHAVRPSMSERLARKRVGHGWHAGAVR